MNEVAAWTEKNQILFYLPEWRPEDTLNIISKIISDREMGIYEDVELKGYIKTSGDRKVQLGDYKLSEIQFTYINGSCIMSAVLYPNGEGQAFEKIIYQGLLFQ
jgi:hypothetical protein